MFKPYKIALGLVALALGTAPVLADNYLLTFQGTVTSTSNAYANVNDAFSGMFVLRSPIAVAGAPGNSFQATGSGAGDDLFQDTTVTGTHSTTTGESGVAPDVGAQVAIFSGYTGFGHPPTPIYGYQFASSPEAAPSTYSPGYEYWQLSTNLESTQSRIAPTGTLADLGNFPLIDFDYVNSFSLTLEQATYTNTVFTAYIPVATETGVVNSYAIQRTVTPEPTTWMLVLMGVLGIVGVARTRSAARG